MWEVASHKINDREVKGIENKSLQSVEAHSYLEPDNGRFQL